jgi:hypothetical protein
MTEPREFICKDCETQVLAFATPHANDQDICAQCQWLRSVADPKERERLRRWFNAQTEQL